MSQASSSHATKADSQKTHSHKPAHYARSDHERVVITGMGVISPVGNDLTSFWANLVAGKSGIERIGEFEGLSMDEFRSQIAGRVKGF